MSETLLQSLTSGTHRIFDPIHQVGKTTIDNLAKITEMQFSTAKYLTDISLNQLKAAAEIKDFDDARSFTSKSIELVSQINKKLVDDGQALAGLTTEYKSGFTNLFNRDEKTEPVVEKVKKDAVK